MRPEPEVWTFVFTDVQDSTPLALALGDEYFGLLETHCQVLRAAWADHDGIEVKTEGDSFFIAFQDPAAAVRACVEGQRALLAHPWERGKAIRVRMGIHSGPARQVGTDFLGSGVNEAARVSDAAHGGQIVISDVTLAVAILPPGVTARDLGRHGLKGITAARALSQIEHPDLPQVFPPLRTLSAARHNLPSPPSPLIGRELVLAEVERLVLDGARLVTLVGSGGIGKTRLALELGWELSAYFPGGVFLVELAAFDRAEDAWRAVADVLQVQLIPDAPVSAQIAEVLTSRTLLVLDNLEQVLDVADGVGELLAAAPTIQVIATSRERLRLRAEQLIRIEPLDTPSPEATSILDVESSEAGAFFLERLVARDRSHQWGDDEAAAITRIIVALEGVPLALELAAARVADLGLHAVATALGDVTSLLVEGDRDLPPRQRSIAAAIQWSVDLLSPQQVEVLSVLSVFRGSAAREAIDAVVARSTSEDVVALSEAHLIALDASGRVVVLEPVRQFATRLRPLATAIAAHRAWYADRSRRAWDGMTGSLQGQWTEELEADAANFRVAIGGAEPQEALAIASGLGRWFTRGRFAAGRAVLEPAIAAGRDAGIVDARALLVLGVIERLQGRPGGRPLLEEAHDVATTRGDGEIALLSAMQVAAIVREQGDASGARTLLTEVLPVAESFGGRTASMLFHELGIATASDEPEQAVALIERAISGFRAVADMSSEVGATGDLGFVLLELGRLEEGVERLSALVAPAQASGEINALSFLRTNLGMLLFGNDPTAARDHFAAAADGFEEVGNLPMLRKSLLNLLSTHRRIGETSDAAETAVRILELAQEEASAAIATQAFLEAGRFEDAMSLLPRLPREGPNGVLTALFEIWALAGLGDGAVSARLEALAPLNEEDPEVGALLDVIRALDAQT